MTHSSNLVRTHALDLPTALSPDAVDTSNMIAFGNVVLPANQYLFMTRKKCTFWTVFPQARVPTSWSNHYDTGTLSTYMNINLRRVNEHYTYNAWSVKRSWPVSHQCFSLSLTGPYKPHHEVLISIADDSWRKWIDWINGRCREAICSLSVPCGFFPHALCLPCIFQLTSHTYSSTYYCVIATSFTLPRTLRG